MDFKIAGKYKPIRKIGESSFGDIFLGQNAQTLEELSIKTEQTRKDSDLFSESKVYRVLQEGSGIPKLIWYGTECDFNFLVTELVGPSLETLFKFCKRPFSLKTILLIADQIISRVEFMHSYNHLHRDIKPENFCIGIGKKSGVIYVNNFGLAKKYLEKNSHIPMQNGKKLVGTARYASVSTHLGLEQSRRDDLEAIGYVLLYLFRGKLPWQGIPAGSKAEKYQKIGKKKQETSVEEICEGLPHEFLNYMYYCRNLRFDEKPDYSFLKRGFKEAYNREIGTGEAVFDWCLPRGRENQKPRKNGKK